MVDEKREPRAKITIQFRSGAAMVYDLSCEDARLTVQIGPQTDEVEGFTAVAHARQSAERPCITQSGMTRGDAVRAVGRAWSEKNGAFGFPRIDWDAVAEALFAVRAI